MIVGQSSIVQPLIRPAYFYTMSGDFYSIAKISEMAKSNESADPQNPLEAPEVPRNEDDSDSEDNTEPIPEIKVVVVGDGAVGKTCLLHVFTHREFPQEYEATIFDNLSRNLVVDGKEVSLQLWDTAGQEGYERIRTLGYEGTDCFVACFSCKDQVTFSNLSSIWLKELRNFEPNAKILLVGTKADLRGQTDGPNELDGDPDRNKEVSLKKIHKLVRDKKLANYVETSARRGGEDVDRVFHEAIRIVLKQNHKPNNVGQSWKKLICLA
ncbi:rho-related protein racD-like [Tigriopus californicus]|uniref:rho-related protein racD-like n=1 Tax=Tigriopus californicus TaxID=6832 RepID=UPI0027D9F0A8|nr:rho-related protein racD-like [Tigriopus californicus]